MSEESAFLDVIRSKPDDDVTRLVYADWLDEQGAKASADKSAFLRLHCELGQAQDAKVFLDLSKRMFNMAKQLDAAWLGVVSNMKIENCELQFEFQCPKRWDKLRPTIRDDVRFCDACQQAVYFCRSVSEARDHAWQGHCVAVQLGLPRAERDLQASGMTVGFIGRRYQERPRGQQS
jgi:uncharacterized protein (TIGR02996 family)